ncbi:anti-phage protein KwaA [Flavobacterium sp.]|uniref:anti-phage protein KwaA n=1 Tax=Flavobacterium sp. TaxID=239 RepID=UPI0039E631E8
MKLKIQLYILSLWLLFLLLLINKIDIPYCYGENCSFIGFEKLLSLNVIPAICLIFVIAGFIFYYKFKYIIKGAKSLPEQVVEIDNLNWEHLTFLVTYVVPLLTFDLDFNLAKDRNGLMLFLVLVIIGMIYVKTNMFYNNPTLAILGYHIYKVTTNKKKNIILISKDSLKEQDWIEYKFIGDNIYFSNKTSKQT